MQERGATNANGGSLHRVSGHVIPDAPDATLDAVPDEHHRRRAERLLGNKLLADTGSAC